MKKYTFTILFTIAALVCGICRTSAKSKDYKGNVSIEPLRVEQHGSFLYVDMDVVLNDLKVKSAKSLELTPQVVSKSESKSLPNISLKGRDEYLSYERKVFIAGDKAAEKFDLPYIAEKASKRKNQTIKYSYIMPYEAWMTDARLVVQHGIAGCGEYEPGATDVFGMISPEPKPYVIIPHASFIRPQTGPKQREIQAEVFLDFVVSKTDIRPNYMNNPTELAKIHKMIDELKSDPDIEINRLDIIGYASPEGTLAFNKRLSEGRAMALRNYLASRYDFPRNIYSIQFGGENWDGLVKALQSMDVDYKQDALDIINNNTIEGGRETKLMALRGGAPYRELLRNVFPTLRVAICKADYTIRDFNVDEAKEIIKTRPQSLSLDEMFMVANTYEVGSEEFVEVFATAVRMYPESELANVNAANAALQRNDTVSAARYLKNIKEPGDSPEYHNAMGALLMMQGEFDKAEQHLSKAAAAGLEAAKANMQELGNKKKSIAEIEARKVNEYLSNKSN